MPSEALSSTTDMATWCHCCEFEVPRKMWVAHVKEKSHQMKLKALAAQTKTKMKIRENFGIIVLGIGDNSAEDLAQQFKQFGKIVALLVEKKFNRAFIQFKDWSAAESAVRFHQNKTHGQSLEVKPRKDENYDDAPNFKSQMKDQLTKIRRQLEQYKKYQTQLPIPNYVDSEISVIVSELESTSKEEEQKNEVISSLEQWLSIKYPGCRIIQFGSSVSGLASRFSDMDIYLDFPQDLLNQMLPDASSTSQIPCAKRHLSLLDSVSSLLRQHPHIRELAVVRARIPVAKFIHVPTGLACDLSCLNKIGIRNSQMIRTLLTLDRRVRPFLFMINFWARKNRLRDLQLTSYALTLMGIFYLQTVQVLPSLSDLQSTVQPEDRIFIQGWNVSFPSNPTSACPKNLDSISNLLRGFFNYYAELDPSDVVICPLLGEIITRDCFATHQLPPTLDPYVRFIEQDDPSHKPLKLDNPFCVQDPFELNFNVTGSMRHVDLFRDKCRAAFDLCDSILNGHDSDEILSLISEKPVRVEQEEHTLYPTDPLGPPETIESLIWSPESGN